jgi:hypothetical protein
MEEMAQKTEQTANQSNAACQMLRVHGLSMAGMSWPSKILMAKGQMTKICLVDSMQHQNAC